MKKPIPYLKTWKQHCWALLAAFILLLLVISQVSIRRTWSVYQQFDLAEQQIARAATATTELATLRQQLEQLGPAAKHQYDRELLLEKVTAFCRDKDLLVTGFPEAQQIEENGRMIVTNQIEVQGAYKAMVELLYLLEQDQELGTVSAVRFFTFEDRGRRKTPFLRGAIVLRNLVL